MKGLVKILVISVSALGLLVACGKDKNTGGTSYTPPFPTVGPYGNQKAYRGTVQITNRSTYQSFLSDSGLCFKGKAPIIPGIWNVGVNTCSWIDRAPVMGLQFDRTDVSAAYGVPGQVIIEALNDWGGQPYGRVPYRTTFYSVNNDTQLEAITYGFLGTMSYNGQIEILVTGKPGDQKITATLTWRGRPFGSVQLNQYQQYNQYQQPYNPNYRPY